jgi:hypothetical protein
MSRVFGVDVDGFVERSDLENEAERGKRLCAEGEISDSVFEADGLNLKTIFAARNIVDMERAGAIGGGSGGEFSSGGEQTDVSVGDNGVRRIKDGARDETGGAGVLRILSSASLERKKRECRGQRAKEKQTAGNERQVGACFANVLHSIQGCFYGHERE